MTDRVIGRYEGERPGPLMVCIGGVHGNEPAGVVALEELMLRLEAEPDKNPECTGPGTPGAWINGTERTRKHRTWSTGKCWRFCIPSGR